MFNFFAEMGLKLCPLLTSPVLADSSEPLMLASKGRWLVRPKFKPTEKIWTECDDCVNLQCNSLASSLYHVVAFLGIKRQYCLFMSMGEFTELVYCTMD